MSFSGGYRGYVVVISAVYYEIKLDISFGRRCRGYVAVVSAIKPLWVMPINRIEWCDYAGRACRL